MELTNAICRGRCFTTNLEQAVLMRIPSCFAACAASMVLLTTQPSLPALAVQPSTEALATLRKGYQAAADGLLPTADSLLTKSIGEWEKTAQPADEISALYKTRGTVRRDMGRNADAIADLSESIKLLSAPSAKPEPADVQRAYLQRARLNAAQNKWADAESDFSVAIARLDDLDAIESTNPYLYRERSSARSRLGQFDGAAEDALNAQVEFKQIGDKLRSLLASSDAALALYGAGEVDEAVTRMKVCCDSAATRAERRCLGSLGIS